MIDVEARRLNTLTKHPLIPKALVLIALFGSSDYEPLRVVTEFVVELVSPSNASVLVLRPVSQHSKEHRIIRVTHAYFSHRDS